MTVSGILKTIVDHAESNNKKIILNRSDFYWMVEQIENLKAQIEATGEMFNGFSKEIREDF